MSEVLPDDLVLHPYRYGWAAHVPIERGSFFNKPIRLVLETRLLPEECDPPHPNEAETALANTILANFPAVLREAEAQFNSYNREHDPNAAQHVRDPHVWIEREELEQGLKWAFVVGRDETKCFGYHIEFDGVECLGIWAGD